MKTATLAAIVAFGLAGAVFPAESPLKDQADKASYSLGLDIGQNLKQAGFDLKSELLQRGLADALSGAQPLLNQEEVQQALETLQQEMRAKMQARQSAEAAKNKEAGEKYLAANKSKEGVVTTKSGLQYKVITEGKGPHPKATDTVQVHYRGSLIDGTEFDSSYKRGEPATFPLDGVIPGWSEGLQLMTVGSKYQFALPAELAYGENAPPGIGPNQVLLFDVELLKIGGEEGEGKK